MGASCCTVRVMSAARVVNQWICCSHHALCKVQWISIVGCPQSSVRTRFSVDLPTNEVPSVLSSGLYNSSHKRWVTGRMKQVALQEECLNATLELTVFTGFQKGGMSKGLFEAIGRKQVVRGIKKNYFFIMLSARGLAH